MTKPSDKTTLPWGLEAAQLPERLEGWRVLEVGVAEPSLDFAARGAAAVELCEQPAESVREKGETFDLLHCSAGQASELHPLAIGAWCWWLLAPGGTLVHGSTALADPELSQYAEFQRVEGSEQRWRWLPGRLTTRWMVENSGFDVDSWLGERPGSNEGEIDTYLQATRVARPPALDLSRQPLGR